MINHKIIDVHAHFITEKYRAKLIDAGYEKPDGMPRIPDWNKEEALKMMDRHNISTAMLSISSPGVHFGEDAQARSLARLVNEEGMEIVNAHPDRFGLFASLPLPDIEGSLDEIDYAVNTLHVDGFVLETNFHGVYLGDDKLLPIFSKLDTYGSILFIHPTSPYCSCNGHAHQYQQLSYPNPMMEFIFDTTRSVINMILMGVTKKFKNIKIIIPHAGAALPVIADRVAGLTPILGLENPITEGDIFNELQSFYYDLAGAPLPRLLPALRTFAKDTHLLYGSDYPFTAENLLQKFLQKIKDSDLSSDIQEDIFQNNAINLFKRLNSNIV
ncbi:amidohydrolase family protein [Rhizosphaericola mali]|uniref:6-methylsalicylate decarboxylase n=1 Tax=Rhizosphaericola mali TaxID=2545455 RepID=A0A5P2G2B9_9BACT|nr:amidohydrolase family protein [Rhizosphaericola mali]QES88239.1 amidohydrolase family protein [Rhizosphaericola mali]